MGNAVYTQMNAIRADDISTSPNKGAMHYPENHSRVSRQAQKGELLRSALVSKINTGDIKYH